jgi:hypothetical protein
MRTDSKSSDEHTPERKREARDVNFRGAFAFGVILAVTLVGVIFVMRAVFWHFARVQALGPEPTPFATARELPPAPRLQAHPQQDLQQTLDGQGQILNSYGWVDERSGRVRIPIDRAMDLLAQQGLPVRGQPPSGASAAAQKNRKSP